MPRTTAMSPPPQNMDRVSDARSTPPIVWGKESSPAFFDTFFDALDLRATPTYNYYIPGEDADEVQRDYAELEELPRYVTIVWRRAPLYVGAKKVASSVKGQLSNPTDILANGTLQAGSVSLRMTVPSLVQEDSVVDEESVLRDPRFAGIPVGQVFSNAVVAAEQDHIYDTIGSSAHVGKVDMGLISQIPRPVRPIRSAKSANVLLVGSAGLSVISQDVDASQGREHLEGMLDISTYSTEISLSDAVSDVLSENSAPVPGEQVGSASESLEYVGYILEKHKLGADGVFRSVSQVYVDSPDTVQMVDTAVAYGAVYRYRICAVVRWVHRADLDVRGILTTSGVESSNPVPAALRGYVARYLKSSWTDLQSVAIVDTVLPKPPDQLLIRPYSRRGTVEISWRFPEDAQRDLSQFAIVRRKVSGRRFLTEWSVIADGLPARNGRYTDTVQVDPDPSVRYVYAMFSRSLHGQVSHLSEQISCRLVLRGTEDPVTCISQPGVPLEAHGALSVSPPMRDRYMVTARDSVILAPRGGPSRVPNQDVDLVLRLESLDTGESRDILIDVNYQQVILPDVPPPRVVPTSDFTVASDDPTKPTGASHGSIGTNILSR